MWRAAVSISSQRVAAASNLLSRRQATQQQLLPNAIRLLSSTGGGDGGDENDGGKDVDGVYADLFGTSDSVGEAAERPTSSGESSWSALDRLKQRNAPAEPQPKDSTAATTQSKEEVHIPIPLWTDNWEIPDDMWESTTQFKDLPEWSPDHVSRISTERVQLLPGEKRMKRLI